MALPASPTSLPFHFHSQLISQYISWISNPFLASDFCRTRTNTPGLQQGKPVTSKLIYLVKCPQERFKEKEASGIFEGRCTVKQTTGRLAQPLQKQRCFTKQIIPPPLFGDFGHQTHSSGQNEVLYLGGLFVKFAC